MVAETRPTQVLSVAPLDMPAAVAAAYEPIPDRRFLYAIADVHRVLTRAALRDVIVRRTAEGWSVHYGPEAVGTLSRYPGYLEARELLGVWARRIQPAVQISNAELAPALSARIDASLADMQLAPMVDALWAIDSVWQSGSASKIAVNRAARLWSLVELQSIDMIGMADAAGGRAMTAHVLARALGAPAPEHEALHAYALGYHAEADSLVRKVSGATAIAAFLRSDTTALRPLASAPRAGNLDQYLELLLVGRTRELTRIGDWMRAHPYGRRRSLAVLKPALETGTYEASDFIPSHVAELILVETLLLSNDSSLTPALRARLWSGTAGLADLRSIMHLTASTTMQVFENTVRATSAARRGPFLDGVAYGALMRGYMYSAYHAMVTYRLDQQAAPGLVGEMLAGLKNAPPGPPTQFQRWLTNITAAESGRPDVNLLIDDVRNLPLLGHATRMRSYAGASDYAGYGTPSSIDAARALVSQLDSRPDQLLDLAEAARDGLRDPRLAHEVFRRWSIVSGHPGAALRVAAFERDDARIMSLLSARAGSPGERAAVLRTLIEDSALKDGEIRRAYAQLYEESGGRWAIAAAHADYLARNQDYRGALAIAEAWLKNGRSITQFDSIAARTFSARMHQRLGDAARGLAVVEPMAATYQAGAMMRTALLYHELGQKQRAQELISRTVRRYPNSDDARLAAARMHWSDREYTQAATLLSDARYPLSPFFWRFDVAPAFLETFSKQPINVALAAVRAFPAGDSTTVALEELAGAAHRSGRSDMAFAIQSSLSTPNSVVGAAELAIRGYRYLRASKDEAAAMRWLQQALPLRSRMVAPMVMYREKEWPLLWSVVAQPFGTPEQQAYTWLLRAAADARQTYKDPHHSELLNRFRNAGSSKYEVAAKHVMGLASIAEMMRYAVDEKSRCELAYFAGVRAEAEGRLRDAAQWYRVALETGESVNGEYVFALDALAKWQSGRARRELLLN